MKINIKLYAMLDKYLPRDSKNNQIELEVARGTTILTILLKLGVPLQLCHLVLKNGVYVPQEERASGELNDGDMISIWPPVAGG